MDHIQGSIIEAEPSVINGLMAVLSERWTG